VNKDKISLIIPVHNEVDIIEQVVRNYYDQVISKIPGSEFIVAEDGSTDGTKEVLARLAKQLPIKLVTSNDRKGYAKAVWDAFKLPKNDIIFFSDSDGQHSPADFWKMIPFIDDFDLITGYKFPRLDGHMRCRISNGMNTIVGLLFGIRMHDINCGFRVMRKKVLDSVLEGRIISDFISTEFLVRAHHKGYRVVEVPVKHYKRPYGDSRWLSTNKLPGIIAKLLSDFMKLKIEFILSSFRKEKR
jgi:glycosyltransferase involved in cell wall biosynthesis